MTRGGAAQGRGCERLAAAAPGSPPRHPTPTARGGAGRRAGRCRLPAVPSRRRGRREEDGHRRVVGQRPPRPRRGTGRTNQWRGRRGRQGHAPRPPPPPPPPPSTHDGGCAPQWPSDPRTAEGGAPLAAATRPLKQTAGGGGGGGGEQKRKPTKQERRPMPVGRLSTTGKWKNKGGGGGDESWLAVEVGCVWGRGNGGKWVRTRFVLCAPARERDKATPPPTRPSRLQSAGVTSPQHGARGATQSTRCGPGGDQRAPTNVRNGAVQCSAQASRTEAG